jgi:hypothetical protein
VHRVPQRRTDTTREGRRFRRRERERRPSALLNEELYAVVQADPSAGALHDFAIATMVP